VSLTRKWDIETNEGEKEERGREREKRMKKRGR